MVLDGRDGSVMWRMKTAVVGMISPLVLHRSQDDPLGDVFVFWTSGRRAWNETEIVCSSCPKCKRKRASLHTKSVPETAHPNAGKATLHSETFQLSRRRRHGAHSHESEPYVPDNDCGLYEKRLDWLIANLTMHSIDSSAEQYPGRTDAGCDANEKIYDLEMFVLDYRRRCNPLILDTMTMHSISYGKMTTATCM